MPKFWEGNLVFTKKQFRFKEKALACYPPTHTNDLLVNTVLFKEVCEAFDILSNGKFQFHIDNLKILYLNCLRQWLNVIWAMIIYYIS